MRVFVAAVVCALVPVASGCANAFTDDPTRIARCERMLFEQYGNRYNQQQREQACVKFAQADRLNDDGSIKPAGQ